MPGDIYRLTATTYSNLRGCACQAGRLPTLTNGQSWHASHNYVPASTASPHRVPANKRRLHVRLRKPSIETRPAISVAPCLPLAVGAYALHVEGCKINVFALPCLDDERVARLSVRQGVG